MPRFSIVVPVHGDKIDYLESTLQSCLNQDFDDFEIIVADNQTVGDVPGVIAKLNSSKIKYFKTPTSLNVFDSWNFAFSKATGDFQTLIPTDDGLLRNVLGYVNEKIDQFKVKIVNWNLCIYLWPDSIFVQQRNYMMIAKHTQRETVVDSLAAIKCYANMKKTANEPLLPNITGSFIHRDLLNSARAQNHGKLFINIDCPDQFLGLICAYDAKSYLHLGRPISVYGLSGKSCYSEILSGSISQYLSGHSDSLSTIPARHQYINWIIISIAHELWYAATILAWQKNIAPHLSLEELTFDHQHLLEVLITKTYQQPQELWPAIFKAIKQTFRSDAFLEKWFDAKVAESQPPASKGLVNWIESVRVGDYGNFFVIDGSQYALKDVYDAATIASNVVDYSATTVNQLFADVKTLEVQPPSRRRFNPLKWFRLLFSIY